MDPNEKQEPKEDEVAEASDESFPASDPPSFTPLHAGTPDAENAKPERNK